MTPEYPRWIHYPLWREPPPWCYLLVRTFRNHQARIDSLDKAKDHLKSNQVLDVLAPDLRELGFVVEGGKDSFINRPVYFEEYGKAARAYRIDSYHPELKLGLEVEAGRATKGNAVYRDIIQTSLLVGVENFALAVPQSYSYGDDQEEPSYKVAKSILDATYSSDRLRLPFQSVLLIGY